MPRCLQQLFVVIKFGNKCSNSKKKPENECYQILLTGSPKNQSL